MVVRHRIDLLPVTLLNIRDLFFLIGWVPCWAPFNVSIRHPGRRLFMGGQRRGLNKLAGHFINRASTKTCPGFCFSLLLLTMLVMVVEGGAGGWWLFRLNN